MSKQKKNRETAPAAAQNAEAFAPAEPAAVSASADQGGVSDPVTPAQKKRKLGGWAITGIAAAGLLLLTGTAGAGALVGAATTHAIVGEQGEHQFAEAGKFGGEHEGRGGEHEGRGGEHEGRGGEPGQMRQRGGEGMQNQMPNAPQGQGGELGGTQDGESSDGQTLQDQTEQGQTQQKQMQRPNMDGQTGAS